MIVIGSRARTQAPPPHIVIEALLQPDRDRARLWLRLLPDETPPRIEAVPPAGVRWTSLWPKRSDAVIGFEVTAHDGGSMLRWVLSVEEPVPDAALTGHLCKRMNELINRDLRYSFGQ